MASFFTSAEANSVSVSPGNNACCLMPAKTWLIGSGSPMWQALNTRVSPLSSGALIAFSI